MKPIIIKDVNIIPMTEKKILYNHDILIEQGVISAIGRNINTGGADLIDYTNHYVIPGLYDMHVHLDLEPMLGILFANGVTGVRNMWGSSRVLRWKKAVEQGDIIGPDIYSAGPLTDGLGTWDGCMIVATPEEAEDAVRQVIDEGFDYFKTYPDIPRETFIKLMETAKSHDFKVMGHGNNNVSTEELIELGYYSLEHSSRLPDNDEDIIKMAKSHMWLTPTHLALKKVDEYVVRNMDISNYPYGEYVGERWRKEWERDTRIRRENPRFQQFNMDNFIKRALVFRKYSARILLGTDTANPGVVPGFSVHDELKSLVEDLRMEPFDAIGTGTVNAAKSLGIDDKYGTIKEGNAADLVILEGNPLADISNSGKIAAIVKTGRIFNRVKLDMILENCRARLLAENAS